MKSFAAFIFLVITIATICFPLYVVWLGLTMDLTVSARITAIVGGLIFCRLVKPVSVLTGKDFKIF